MSGYYPFIRRHTGPVDFASQCVRFELNTRCCACGAEMKPTYWQRCDSCINWNNARYNGQPKNRAQAKKTGRILKSGPKKVKT